MQSLWASVGPGIVREGGWNYQSSPSAGVTQKPRPLQNDFARAWPDCAIRFRATCSTIQINVYCHGSSVELWVDGVPTTKTTLSTSGALTLVTVGTGLDGANEHEYAISTCNAGGGQYTSILQVQADGTFNMGFASLRPAILGYGDSIVAGMQGTGGNTFASWLSRLAVSKSYQVINRGINGQLCETVGVNTGAADLVLSNGGECGWLLGQGLAVNDVIVQLGHNDARQSGFNATAFQASYVELIQAFQLLFPNATLLCLGMLPTSDTTNGCAANRPAVNAAIAAAVSANPSPTTSYVSTDGWIDTTHSGGQYDTLDGIHPTGGTLAGQTGDGSGKLVTQLAPLVV